MNEAILLESASARSDQAAKFDDSRALEMLNKAKALIMAMWEGKGLATTEQMAEYYGVSVETLRKAVTRHREELESDGMQKATKKELKALPDMVRGALSLTENAPSALLFTPRAALRLGMLLRESPVAQEVRTLILDVVEAVPAQNDRIRELELRLKIAEAEERAAIAKYNLSGQFNNMCALHGEAIALASIGQGDRVVDVEKPTIEVHTQEGEPFKGQTLSQLKTHLEKKYGVRFKSGADIQRRLQALGRGDLVEYIPRQVNQGAVSSDKVEEAIALLTGGDRQMLLGEGGGSALVKRKPTKPSRARETAGSYA